MFIQGERLFSKFGGPSAGAWLTLVLTTSHACWQPLPSKGAPFCLSLGASESSFDSNAKLGIQIWQKSAISRKLWSCLLRGAVRWLLAFYLLLRFGFLVLTQNLGTVLRNQGLGVGRPCNCQWYYQRGFFAQFEIEITKQGLECRSRCRVLA
jgi:hypothetical protein